MNTRLGISFSQWRMERRPYVIYAVAVTLCILVYFLSLNFYEVDFLVGLTFKIGPLLILALPIVQSMRLRDMGHSAFWPVLPLVGLLVLFVQVLTELASIGGAPGGGPEPLSERLAWNIGLGCLSLTFIGLPYGFFRGKRYASEQEQNRQ